MTKKINSHQTVKTKYGTFLFTEDKKGKQRLQFPNNRNNTTSRAKIMDTKVKKTTVSALKDYFKGNFKKIRHFSPDLSTHTPFEKNVIKSLLKVPPGKVITYGELAKKAGYPNAARAVGSVMRKNPLPILIPCHRVLAANKGLGGYSQGLNWKKRLLAFEKQVLMRSRGNAIIRD